jgi:hypothetical protein
MGRGAHVDMAVDMNDNIHLAYYDSSSGGLYYAYIRNNGGTQGFKGDVRPDTTSVKTARVDTYSTAGTKLMLNLRLQNGNYVPYISYYHVAFTGTKNAIRVAWRKDFTNANVPPDGTNADYTFTGKWEVMTVPVQNTPLYEEFICNGVPATASGWVVPAAGVLSWGSKLDKSILLGYMTDTFYEGAILKKDIW